MILSTSTLLFPCPVTPGQGYLVCEPKEEAPGEVQHIDRPGDLGVHVLDANESADGDDGPVAAEAIT